MTRKGRTPSSMAVWAGRGAALLVILAVAWGGATTRPAQAAVLGGLGLLWLLAPAQRWPGRGFIFCSSGLVALALTAWLPVQWFAVESWRHGVEEVGIALPATLSPQPWLSAEALFWLIVCLGWVAWLLGQPWDATARRAAMRLLAGGIILIAATALVAWWRHWSIPFWISERGFGPFPNRNHTGHVFALGGVLALGCAADAGRRNWRQALCWIGGAAVVLVALIVNYSRGGLLVFVGAMVVWSALFAWQRQSWKLLAIGGSGVLVVASLVLVGGGAVASRFAGGADSQVAFRVLIWRDTLALIHASPWCGAGLGNFQALFPFYRQASVIQQSVLHPESDWLWLASELGWLGVILALGAAIFVLREAFPWARGSQRRLRGAAFAAAVAGLVHCAIDVPGHRLGSAMTLLFIMVLARGGESAASPSRFVPVLCRLSGFIGFGLVVLTTLTRREVAPADTLLRNHNYAGAEAAANRALARAPLDWKAYFTRAGALACQGKTLEAVADFRRARRLEPHYAGVPFEEGRFWLQTQPGLALIAWREALRRARPPYDGEVYGQMLASANDAAFRGQLLALAQSRPPLQLTWFQTAPPEEARAHLEQISATAQFFTPEQRAAFEHRVEEIGGSTSHPVP